MTLQTLSGLLYYVLAAVLEISGCFALWAVLRLHRSAWWIAPGMLALLLFAIVLTRIHVTLAGRAYAAYGGIYILASLAWMWAVEGRMPDRYDLAGALLCLSGSVVILLGSHGGNAS